jgi:sugar phosphate permease
MARNRTGPWYRWQVVALLWACGFFNYADRQALMSVFPTLAKEMGLSLTRLGMLGSAFMVVYALAAPIAGAIVDRWPRRALIVAGLAFWSVICAATGSAAGFSQLVWLRAAEGLGESCYFPASMSLLADYHPRETRSRAMSLHQTSVYVGTAGGGILAGFLAGRYGWRQPFWALGLAGMAYAILLWFLLVESPRGASDGKSIPHDLPEDDAIGGSDKRSLLDDLRSILRHPSACALLLAFAGANFVAMALMTWLPTFVFQRFGTDLLTSATIGTFFLPMASLVGVLLGGVLGDASARRRPGGRMTVQGVALLLGAPCVFVAARSGTIAVLILALTGIGLCKGIYDASIFASIYDVIGPSVRGTAAGLMNTIGWAGGALAPVALGLVGDRYGLGPAIAATAAAYLLAGLCAIGAGGMVGGGIHHKGTKGTKEENQKF